MSNGIEYKYEATAATRARLHALMQGHIDAYKPIAIMTWRFWLGFIWGAIIIASMDYGDVHFCVGQCDGQSPFIAGANP